MNIETLMTPGPAGATEYAFARVDNGFIVGVANMYGEAARESHRARFPLDIECPPAVTPTGWHYKYGRFEQKGVMGALVRGNSIVGIKGPCYIVVNGIEYEVEDGVTELELNFDAPGKYEVRITMNPEFFDEVHTIEKDHQG
ncbi:hypothetical protein Axy20_062 [Achromobacter phage vB_AxyS_19-32_Axy20]|nr:hypothetical protein Axy18_060 [Achromobacter phage vB_AxyS_19-32_Axy18]QDH84510.1 hypothetical protein Axy20_062 [Achromobacter phage vB_AxyS_19-32_Axy20]